MKKLLFLFSLFFLTSCSITLNLFPTKGPLSENLPVKVIKAKATNVTSNSGKCFLTMKKCNRHHQ